MGHNTRKILARLVGLTNTLDVSLDFFGVQKLLPQLNEAKKINFYYSEGIKTFPCLNLDPAKAAELVRKYFDPESVKPLREDVHEITHQIFRDGKSELHYIDFLYGVRKTQLFERGTSRRAILNYSFYKDK